jgi:hypothetical protein
MQPAEETEKSFKKIASGAPWLNRIYDDVIDS